MGWIKEVARELRAGVNILIWTWRQGKQMKCYHEEPEHRKGCKIAMAIALAFLALALLLGAIAGGCARLDYPIEPGWPEGEERR